MDKNAYSSLLQRWYAQNKRELPWRETREAYTIWISEIILQQTRVEQGKEYFLRFVNRFPDVKTLAEASEQEVLKLWQGLGYYSRARNLHAAAKEIAAKHAGVFPQTYNDIRALKGVGDYTASAVSSIAFGEPYAVVDGNVYRVLSRLFAISEPIDRSSGKRLFAEMAQSVLDKQNPAIHNQAMMDLGAMVCTPLNPRCDECPLQKHCLAFAAGSTRFYPVKQGKTKQQNRYFHYFHIRQDDYTFISKRENRDIWKNLYEFPLIETPENTPFEVLAETERFKALFPENILLQFEEEARFRHILSHQVIYATFYRIRITGQEVFRPHNSEKIVSQEIDNYPVSRLMHKYLETF